MCVRISEHLFLRLEDWGPWKVFISLHCSGGSKIFEGGFRFRGIALIVCHARQWWGKHFSFAPARYSTSVIHLCICCEVGNYPHKVKKNFGIKDLWDRICWAIPFKYLIMDVFFYELCHKKTKPTWMQLIADVIHVPQVIHQWHFKGRYRRRYFYIVW